MSRARTANRRLPAAVHADLGEIDAAFAWLEKAYETRDRSVLLLKVNPGFDSLRGDPRLAQLATRVGLAVPYEGQTAPGAELKERESVSRRGRLGQGRRRRGPG